MKTRIACGIGAAAVVVAGLTGCHVSASAGKTISQSQLESKGKEALQGQVQVTLDQFKCKGDLDAKAGATQQCAISYDGGKWQIVTATATDDKGAFHVNTVPGVIPEPDWAK